MLILAIDTSTSAITVAIHDDERVRAQASHLDPRAHTEWVAPLVEKCLTEASAAPTDLTGIVVGNGPGPFTGLRVGIVTARTLGFVLEVPVYGVCSLDVIAVQVAESAAPDGGFLVATDARRKEVYLASYDADGRRLEGPVVTRPAEVATDAPVAGAGPLLYPDHFPHAIPPERPSAGWLAHAVSGELVELLDPEPLYLRRPDAVAGAPRKPVS